MGERVRVKLDLAKHLVQVLGDEVEDAHGERPRGQDAVVEAPDGVIDLFE